MNNLFNFKLFFLFFVILVIASLISGFYCQYSEEIVLNQYNEEITVNPLDEVCIDFMKIYWQENGFIETLQVIFLAISVILLIKIKFKF